VSTLDVDDRLYPSATARRWRRLTMVLPLVLALSLIGVPERAALARAKPAPRPACPASRPDEASARITARMCHGRVLVASATTESSLTWANPDGTMLAEMAAGPERIQRDGRWIDIDTDLRRDPDGVVRAGAHPADLDVFGGDTTATRAKAGDRRVKGGGAELRDAKGTVVGVLPEPSMWTAELDSVSQLPVRTARVDYTLTDRPYGVDVTLKPDMKFLTDPATRYPVTLDPDINLSGSFDTYVRRGMTTDASAATQLAVGTDASGNPARAFLNWNAIALHHKQIVEAHLGLWNFYSATCGDRPIDVYSAEMADSTNRWEHSGPGTTGQPTIAATKSGSTSGSKGQASCAAGYIYTPAHALDGLVQGWANTLFNQAGMALVAPSETDIKYYKAFNSGNASSGKPFMYVTYNSYPTLGALSTSPSTTCGTGASRPFVNTAQPTLKAVINDAESVNVRANFEWWVTGGSKIGGVTSPLGAKSFPLWTVVPTGALSDGGTYSWRVQGNDGTGVSPWSGFCEFTVDTTAPSAAPLVSSTAYPAGQWAGAAGTSSSFTFGAAGVTDVSAYEYGLDNADPDQPVNAAALGGTGTVTITPTTDGPHVLSVRSRDRAGNRSAITQYSFMVGAGAVTAPRAGDLSTGTASIEGIGQAGATGVTYQWRRGDADAWQTIPAGDVALAVGNAPITWPLATTGGGTFAKLNWNVAATLNAAEAGPDPLDGPLQVQATFTGGAVVPSGAVKFALDRNLAWADSEDVGIGSVNLVTGNLSVNQSDASVGGGIGRTANTRLAGDVDPMFGPGWDSGVSVPGRDSEYTDLTVTGSLVQIGLSNGATIGFTKKSNNAFEPQAGMEALKLSYSAAGDTYTLTDQSDIAVTFGHPAGQPATTYVPTAAAARGSSDEVTYSWETVTVAGTALVRPTTILSPSPTGVTCTAASLVRGCRATKFTYATATTASGTSAAQWGDFAGRVKEVSFTAWDPDASPAQMKTVVLQRYTYDNTGRLRSAWDPRLDWTESGQVRHVGPSYAYDSDGLLTELRPPGQEPWTLTYTVVPGDSGKGRLAQVSRGIGADVARTTVVYQVPTSGAGAPYDLSASQTVRWAQPEPPVLASAIFPATQVPNGNQANGTLPSSYERATVSYLDANGRIVNTAEPGGYISSQWYDTWGNQTRSLDAANRQRALNDSPSDRPDEEAISARALSSLSIYSDDGSQLIGTLEPERNLALPDGSAVQGRPYTSYTYDEGAPATDEDFNLVTTETRMARVWGGDGAFYDADKRITKTTYDWTLAQALTETVDPGGLNLVTRYQYDPVTKQRSSTTGPGGNATGNTPSTQQTVYYRAGTGSGESVCDNRPEFARMVCRIKPGGQAATGPAVATKTMTYDMFGQPRVTEESTSAGVLRTTVVTYDAAARPVRQSVTAAAGLGEAVPTAQTVYDLATGQATRVQSLNGSGAVTAEVVRAYDGLGRLTSYTDADGTVSTFAYDLLDRPTTTTDGRGTRTYGYDGGTERRGLATSVVDSQAGTYTASYSANGTVVAQQWPNGVTVQVEPNEDGEAVGITYGQPGCSAGDCTLFSESLAVSVHGQSRAKDSSLSHQDLSYDAAGRLTSVRDSVDGNCVTRQYGYDASTNRTETVSYNPGEDGACQTGTVANRITRQYDQADRLTTAGYEYDALGRTRIMPAADSAVPGGGASTLSYHSTDMARTITQADRSSVYQLDVIGNRYRSWTETRGAVTTTKINHYSADDDSPSWTDEGNNTATRPIFGVAGLVGIYHTATGLSSSITNLHGDIVAGMAGSTPGLSYTDDYLEDGQLRNAADTGSRRCGWLGAEQRASDTPNGLSLMGARLYNSGSGRFLSTDPVYGGNANPYDYCAGDGVNCSDLTGLMSCKKFATTKKKTLGIPWLWHNWSAAK
jgi:RHS repeat-associated protein